MKVLHVLDHSVPVFSGYSFRSRSIVTFQKRLGLEPVVLTSPKHGPAPATVEEHDGIRHYRTEPMPAGGFGARPFVREVKLMARLARRIADVARRERVDVIHAHSPVLNGLPAMRVARRLGLPFVYEARAFWEDAAADHGTYAAGSLRYRLGKALETAVFNRADRAITICEGMRSDLVARGVPRERLAVVGNGVDAEWFRPAPRDTGLAARLGVDGGIVFGFVGSFYHYEGLSFLLDAAAELERRLPRARILLVGGGPEEPALRERAARLGGLVRMPGKVPHDEVRSVYSEIDVFVCPRLRSRLTELVTPLKPLEAMAMSRTVLASDVGGQTELVEAGVTGLVFEAERQESFVAEAVRAGADAALRTALGARAREHVLGSRTWERMVSRYPDIYTAAAHRRQGAA